ncbi:MAG: methyl-accepting chemotaxis protein [Uliginosibacterium sp.]|nr:methyl-accepting chemotaxis protein [Uliginosibacterium sp.]
MRNNQPVSGKERPYPAGRVIISRTDSKGRITDVNAAFAEISGFDTDELIGLPHNMLRHPDMSAEVFRDLWVTLKAGRPWSGVIKNRCKNGDHYWVRATTTALPGGAGYLSVRTEASRADIQRAEVLYARPRLRLDGGRRRPSGLFGWLVSFSRRVRLAWRFWATFAVFAALMLLGAGVAQYGQRELENQLRDYIQHDQARLLAYGQMYAQGLQTGQAIRNIILDPKNPKAYENLAAAEKAFDAALAKAEGLVASPAEGDTLKQIQGLWSKDRQLKSQLSTLARDGDTAGAIDRLNKEETPVWRSLKDVLLRQGEASRQQSETTALRTLGGAAEQRRLGLGLTAFAMLAGIAMFGAMINYPARNMRRTRELLHGIAESGDLSAPLPISMYDEIGEVLTQIVLMRSKLHELVADLVDRIALMAPQAHSLNEAANAESLASERQSKSATAMAAAIEELTVTVDQVRDRANESREIALRTEELAQNGGTVIRQAADEISLISTTVQQAVESVATLQQHSAQISNIVQVIREIADQTNLLALNAAIEAARAGESGRGFAVVADEVRKLAERTSGSTQEISRMVSMIQQGTLSVADGMQASTARVTEGVALANRADEAITEIQTSVIAAANAVSAIFDALKEQAAAAHEIASRVEEIATDSEQGTHAASQTSASATQLSTLTDEMQQLAQRFRIT